ncbi:MAG: 16S rRNA (cytidine(1402)-2'-O)-methyltransferase [Alphaproteobacteria bacterium]
MIVAGLAEANRESGASPAAALQPGLYLVATPIGHRGDITLRALATLAQADMILCEDTRSSGALLRAYGIKKPLLSYHDHNAAAREADLIARLQRGAALALISDAGMPLISDPGFRLARACKMLGLPVTACPGPSAAITGLALSGLPPEPFLFLGFLPNKSGARRNVLRPYATVNATLICYESPQRLAATLADMAAELGDRPAAVGRELTKIYEESRTGTLTELAAHYTAHPPKGEITITVAPPENAAPAADRLDTLLHDALQRGSLRDAVAAVMAATGLPKSQVYSRALELRESAP